MTRYLVLKIDCLNKKAGNTLMRSDFSSNNIEIRATKRPDSLNSLIANDELSCLENLTFLWT